MNKFWNVLLLVLLMNLGSAAAHADSFTFSLMPTNGDFGGPPGSTVGWGYTVSNSSSSTDALQLLDVNGGIFSHGILDTSSFADDVLAPGQSVTWLFDPVLLTGLASFTWDADAPIGFTNSGDFIIGYDFCGNGGCSPELTVSLPYAVTVTVTATPEPSSFLLLLSGLAVIGLCSRRIGINGNAADSLRRS